jgi:hypothetical protein
LRGHSGRIANIERGHNGRVLISANRLLFSAKGYRLMASRRSTSARGIGSPRRLEKICLAGALAAAAGREVLLLFQRGAQFRFQGQRRHARDR